MATGISRVHNLALLVGAGSAAPETGRPQLQSKDADLNLQEWMLLHRIIRGTPDATFWAGTFLACDPNCIDAAAFTAIHHDPTSAARQQRFCLSNLPDLPDLSAEVTLLDTCINWVAELIRQARKPLFRAFYGFEIAVWKAAFLATVPEVSKSAAHVSFLPDLLAETPRLAVQIVKERAPHPDLANAHSLANQDLDLSLFSWDRLLL